MKENVSNEPEKNTSKETIKSQFKRAIRFFKNLEQNSRVKLDKTKNNDDNVLIRRFSLDMENNHPDMRFMRKGGSLNLENVSKRFSINNLYGDVFGNRGRGSFRGTPNKDAVISSLGSLSKDLDKSNFKTQDENISYNLFVSRAKTKKRKSLRALFDVNY